jgi:hypothetical protein
VGDVIANYDHLLMHVDDPVKVMKNEEPTEVEPVPPEGIRNPRIEIMIIPGWRIVGDHWRPSLVVIVVDHRRIWVFGGSLRLGLSIFIGRLGYSL